MKSKSKIVSTPKLSSYDNKNENSCVDVPNFNESPECMDELSKESLPFPVFVTCESEEQDLTTNRSSHQMCSIKKVFLEI